MFEFTGALVLGRVIQDTSAWRKSQLSKPGRAWTTISDALASQSAAASLTWPHLRPSLRSLHMARRAPATLHVLRIAHAAATAGMMVALFVGGVWQISASALEMNVSGTCALRCPPLAPTPADAAAASSLRATLAALEQNAAARAGCRQPACL